MAWFIFLGTIGCSPSIAPFSGAAYEQAVDLKVESLRLMDDAEMPFSASRRKIESLKLDLQKAYEFNLGRPRNSFSTQQWAIMMDPDRHLLGGFLKRWEDENSLNHGFIVEAKRIIGAAFDAIIGLESGKIRPRDLDTDSTFN